MMKQKKPGDIENYMRLSGNMHPRDFRAVAKDLQNLIEFRGYENITIDMSGIDVVFADTMVPLIAFMRRYQEDGVRFDLVVPDNNRLKSLFIDCGWAYLIDPRKHRKGFPDKRGNIPAQVFTDSDAQNKIVNDTLDSILRAIPHLERNHLSALEWSLNEVTDNVLVHSESNQGGVVQLSLHRDSKEIEFVVADSGIGIPNSLRSSLRPGLSDRQILEKAIEEGVTRGTGQGNGLYGSSQICGISGGAFVINSGRGRLSISRDNRIQIRDEAIDFLGTAVNCTISYAKPLLLEKALKFGGKPFDPVDFIELKYEQSDNVLLFIIRNEAKSVGSRLAGYEARTKLENLISMTGAENIVVDLLGSGLMSSSFADEFFVKMAQKMGVERFVSSFKLINSTELNINIINRSSLQRLNLPIGYLISVIDR